MTNHDLLFLMSPERALHGWVDMHAHPMSHLAFAGKLVHGGPDVGSLLPTDSHGRQRVRAVSMEHALGADNCTHGGWGLDNTCGDYSRQAVIDELQRQNGAIVTPDRALGASDFPDWPKWNDITHQKMWVDWIRRAYWGGLRVMVALAVHNQTIAAAVGGPGDGPMDDEGSAKLQIDEMKAFVGRHLDFMQVAYSPRDLREIVRAGKIAVVLGVEIDAIGNFHKGTHPTLQALRDEFLYLYGNGVRYIFPLHLIDNKLGGTAVYKGAFDISNYREYGDFFHLQCSTPADNITYRYTVKGFNLAVAIVKAVKLGIDPFRNPPTPPACVAGTGHMNSRGLTPLGEDAIKEMMKLGMMIDIDHMSQKSANRALELAEAVVDGGYPLNSGHNGPRSAPPYNTEYNRTESQLQQIGALGGMLGLSTAGVSASTFVEHYNAVMQPTGNIKIGLGSDLNGLVKAPCPGTGAMRYDDNFPRSVTGGKEWDYNIDGVAHYGMLPDFLRDVGTVPGGAVVSAHLFRAAESFARMWERCEAQKTKV